MAKIALEAAAFLLALVVAGIYYCQLDTMQHAMKIDQRAWVGFGQIEKVTLEDGKPFVLYIPVKNLGKTPAKSAAVGITPAVGGLKLDRPNAEESVEHEMGAPVALLLPNETEELHIDIRNPPEVAKIKSGEMTIFIFGKVIYADVFGFQHWTRYCYQSLPDKTEGFKFRPCDFYAGIDPEND
jgi:hypothetical protein